jgi:HPt (histidine-containing phosphotransfer) domain-containing protein
MTTPVIDGRQLQTACAGKSDIAVQMVDGLIAGGQPLVTSIGELTERHMNDALCSAAHSLQDIAGNVGAVRLQGAAADLEAAAHGSDWDGIAGRAGQVRQEFSAVQRLRAAWNGDPGGPQACFSAFT